MVWEGNKAFPRYIWKEAMVYRHKDNPFSTPLQPPTKKNKKITG